MKKKISLFFRKPVQGYHYSIEGYFSELFLNTKSEKYEYNFKICPFYSNGIFKRILLIIWAFFNQGDINHVTGDINFISLLLEKKKTINTFHDTYSLKRLKGIKKLFFGFFWIILPILKSKIITSNSRKTEKELINYFNYKTKSVVIGIFAKKIFKKKLKIKISLNPNILVIGTAINKNLENIIKSVKGIKCKLIIVGNLSEDHVRKLKMFKINYTNYLSVNDKFLYKLYLMSDILLFISKYEGFGIPILEAQSVGRVVITSDIDPLKYVAGNGAYFVKPNKVTEIKKAINIVLKNKKKRVKLIKNGFKNLRRFKKSEILIKYNNLYKEI